MASPQTFDIKDFLPYLLNLAAEQTSIEFQATYKNRYGMLRMEWRVLYHLGRYGEMTAKSICDRAHIHKTKASRAVKALEQRRYITRTEVSADRRNEMLCLTKSGQAVYRDLCAIAGRYEADLTSQFSPEEYDILQRCLKRLIGLGP